MCLLFNLQTPEVNLEITILITKALNGECSQDELEQLNVWRTKAPENEMEYLQYVTVWEDALLGHQEQPVLTAEQSWSSFSGKIKGHPSSRPAEKHWIIKPYNLVRIAAAVTFLIIAGFYLTRDTDFTAEFRTSTADRLVTLPDGSMVHLAPESFIKAASQQNGKIRLVNLEGQAHFEVAPDQEKPFVVVAGDVTVEVVGTDFYVAHQPGNVKKIVEVNHGKVQLKVPGNMQAVLLEAGDRAEWNEKEGVLHLPKEIDRNNWSWHTGVLLFSKSALSEVIQVFNDHYKADITILNKDLAGCKYTGRISSISVDEALEILAVSFNFEIQHSVHLQYALVGGRCK